MRSIHYSWGLLLKCTIYELICIKLGTTFIGMKYIQFKTIIAMQCNAMYCFKTPATIEMYKITHIEVDCAGSRPFLGKLLYNHRALLQQCIVMSLQGSSGL